MKRQHPIRKMQHAMEKAWWSGDTVAAEHIAARHVKPLLDALEWAHEHSVVVCSESCPECRLLAAWKEPIK